MGRKCCYPECKSTEGLHSLPSSRETAHRWLLSLGRLHTPSVSVYVCNQHFTRDCFSNYAEVEMGFKKQLLLNPDAVPTPAKVLTQGTAGSFCRILPDVRHVASQTDPTEGISIGTQPSTETPTDPPGKRSVGTQLSMKTLQNRFRSTATQAKVPSRDCGVCTLTFPLDSPLLFLQPTIVKRPSKRPRLSLSDEEEGPCSPYMVVQGNEGLTNFKTSSKTIHAERRSASTLLKTVRSTDHKPLTGLLQERLWSVHPHLPLGQSTTVPATNNSKETIQETSTQPFRRGGGPVQPVYGGSSTRRFNMTLSLSLVNICLFLLTVLEISSWRGVGE